MTNYFFAFYGGIPSPDQRAEHKERWEEWIQKLKDADVWVSGEPFAAAGMEVSAEREVAPFSEAGDRINGYAVVKAEDMETATTLLKTCPHFDFGGTATLHETVSM